MDEKGPGPESLAERKKRLLKRFATDKEFIAQVRIALDEVLRGDVVDSEEVDRLFLERLSCPAPCNLSPTSFLP